MFSKIKYPVLILILVIITIISLVVYNIFWKQPDISNFDLKGKDNWYLPSQTKLAEKGGFYDYWTENIKPEAESVELNWMQIEPNENQYDWTILKDRLAKAKQNKRKIWLRIYMSDRKLAPQWAKDKFKNLPELKYGPYQELTTGSSPGTFYPIWDVQIESRIKLMMQDLAKQNILSDPDFAFMYVPFAWRWNEWELKFVTELIQAGFTPKSFLEWFEKHLQIYTNLFKGLENKLMYTGIAYMNWADGNIEWIKETNNLKTGNNLMADIAVKLGLSVRVGDMEYFNNFSFLPSWGRTAVLDNGYYYQKFDPNHPLIKDPKRLIGSENEAFGDDNMFPKTKEYYYPRMNTLKSLQLGVNWLNTQGKTYDLAPDVFEYARLSVGRSIDRQLDAWVSLREWKDLSTIRLLNSISKEDLPFNPDTPFRNWEKLLYQREVEPDGKTRAAIEVGNTKDNDFFFYNGTAFEALKTDISTGNKYFYFAVDSVFIQQNIKYKLAVTFLDDSSGSWAVEYFDNSNTKRTIEYQKTDTKEWKTTLLDLPEIQFEQKFSGENDFRIYAGNQDLTLTFVRLIKE